MPVSQSSVAFPQRTWRHQSGVRREEVQLAAVGSPARIPAALDRDRIALPGFREAASLRSRIGRSGRRRRRSNVRRGRPALRTSMRHLEGRAPVDRWPASSRSTPRPPVEPAFNPHHPAISHPAHGLREVRRLSERFDVACRHRRDHEIEGADASALKQRQHTAAIRRPDRMPVRALRDASRHGTRKIHRPDVAGPEGGHLLSVGRQLDAELAGRFADGVEHASVTADPCELSDAVNRSRAWRPRPSGPWPPPDGRASPTCGFGQSRWAHQSADRREASCAAPARGRARRAPLAQIPGTP